MRRLVSIEGLIIYTNEENAIHFISGMAMGIDMICAETVLLLKDKYPEITLECAIPCETQAAKWSERYRDRYFYIVECCDKETMLETHYSSGCMQRRNKYMVDRADFVLAVWNGKPSGTQNTIKYAQITKKKIIYINPNDFQ